MNATPTVPLTAIERAAFTSAFGADGMEAKYGSIKAYAVSQDVLAKAKDEYAAIRKGLTNDMRLLRIRRDRAAARGDTVAVISDDMTIAEYQDMLKQAWASERAALKPLREMVNVLKCRSRDDLPPSQIVNPSLGE